MKKLLMAICLTCAMALVANAADKKSHEKPTPEQKEARKALLEKYDKNKDGKLDKDERSKIPAEDLKKAGIEKKKKADK